MSTRAYLRASMSKQELSPEVQQELINNYCKSRGLGEPIVYLDKSTTGGVFVPNREAGGRLMRDLRKGDQVVLAKADRMFRSLKDCVNICEEFKRMEITLHIVNFHGMQVDLGTPIGRALLQMMACFAELEKSMISERTSDTVKMLKRRGLAVGRPPLGFKHARMTRNGERVHVVVPDLDERAVMAMIASWRKQKWSYQQIYEKLTYELKIRTRDGKEWDPNRIRRAWKAETMLQLKELGTSRVNCNNVEGQSLTNSAESDDEVLTEDDLVGGVQ
jgi:DNA invertase Pin-like site-specific DNA recombinase